MRNDSTLALVLGAALVLSALYLIVERAVARVATPARPPRALRRGWKTDLVYLVMTVLITSPVVRLATLLPVALLVLANVTSLDTLRLGAYHGFGPLATQPIWLQAAEIYALADLIGYWSHRLFHSGGRWRFHAVHHSSEDLDWLGSMRVHPVDELTTKLLQSAPILLLGFNPAVTASAAPVFMVYAMLLHANLHWDLGPLRGVIATPVFHRWHHAKDPEAQNKNFADLFPVWDILFGTYYMPRDRRPSGFGIQEPMPSGYLAQIWAPFAWPRPPGR